MVLWSRIFTSYQNRNTEELRYDNESKLKLCKVETLTRWRKTTAIEDGRWTKILFSIFYFPFFLFFSNSKRDIRSTKKTQKIVFGLKKKGGPLYCSLWVLLDYRIMSPTPIHKNIFLLLFFLERREIK